MNIVEAVKLALKTGKPISEGIGDQHWISDIHHLVQDLSVYEIISEDWDVVEDDLIEKKITPHGIRIACVKKKVPRSTAEAIIDALWGKDANT
jgi:hypothetical protein